MTYFTDTRPLSGTIIGPYSPWPRKEMPKPRHRTTLFAGGAAGAVFFVHCIAPVLMGA